MRNEQSPTFRWLDGLILACFSTVGLYAALWIDREYMKHLPFFRTNVNTWTSPLPYWLEDLDLSAKRVQFDFLAFLTVLSPGVGLVTFRRRSSWQWGHLPGPGLAASAAAAIAVIYKVLERVFLVSHQDPNSRSLDLIWPIGRSEGFWSAMDWGWGIALYQVETGVTGAIIGVWVYLTLARAWRARDDWRDCLGRWLGWCWLGNIAFHPLVQLIWG
jgi:hypothetical protein